MNTDQSPEMRAAFEKWARERYPSILIGQWSAVVEGAWEGYQAGHRRAQERIDALEDRLLGNYDALNDWPIPDEHVPGMLRRIEALFPNLFPALPEVKHT